MTCRSNQFQNDWDPMRDDYNDTTYDLQYPDEESSGGVNLDHCRLYITNIPKGLNDEGLRTAFCNYGTLKEVHISKDPVKRYGLVSYETAGEAKLAMTKLNRTEPLKLNISIAHKKRVDSSRNRDNHRQSFNRPMNNRKEENRKQEVASVGSRGSIHSRPNDDISNGDVDDLRFDDEGLDILDPDLNLELEQLKLEQLKLKEAQLLCKHRILVKKAEKRVSSQNSTTNRKILPDGRIVVCNDRSSERDAESTSTAGAGDSNERRTERGSRPCRTKIQRSWDNSSSGDGSSTPSTCVLCSEDSTQERKYNKDKSVTTKYPDTDRKYTDNVSKSESVRFTESKATELTSKKSLLSKVTSVHRSDVTNKKLLVVNTNTVLRGKSEINCDLKYSDFYSENDGDVDETNRLIQLRNTDYLDIVEDTLKVVVALAGYPKSKIRLRQMELFQKSLSDVIDMQLKAGLLKKVPSFLDYYLNRGAIVCICKDYDTRDWIVRVCPGLQERMANSVILLKAKVKRLCLAVLKIPETCWPATAQDAFKLLQYFNPTLKTGMWKIYEQKKMDNVECTSFLIDRVSGEIIRGPNFKNVIDYNQMEFELAGYTEIYYECLLSDLDDLCSLASRVKLLQEIRSEGATPRHLSESSLMKHRKSPVCKVNEKKNVNATGKSDTNKAELSGVNIKEELTRSLAKDVIKKLKDVKYISEENELIMWSDDTLNSDNDAAFTDKDFNDKMKDLDNIPSTSVIAISDKSESVAESNDNLNIRNSNVNIDSNRGIAYHRRTNYLHVENELKTAITLEGYPQNKLEGTHIRRLKHLFKEYLHKDVKMQRFADLIIPKFQDVYLSNGAVIYICDSIETIDYLKEVLPKFVNSTGLKLTFRDIKKLVRYTRVVMRLPKEFSHVESAEILSKLESQYPGLKPACWKYYSDVAGKQKRQFGVDPESLEVIKSPDFDPTYEGEKLSFRIIDRQKRDVSFEEQTITFERDAYLKENKELKAAVLKNMYVPIDPEIMYAPLTKIRTEHYSDIIDDDLKLYVGPHSYPEVRVDESQFHLIQLALEIVIYEFVQSGDLFMDNIPKLHDMYLFDGVVFVICQNMTSRVWIEQILPTLNASLSINLKATEFRGAVGIVSMYVKTERNIDEVIEILQKQNPRLRTKFWRKISTVQMQNKLDVVLQIDKLSAQVIISKEFNRSIDSSGVTFQLGHLQSLIKPRKSLEALTKAGGQKKRARRRVRSGNKKGKSNATSDTPDTNEVKTQNRSSNDNKLNADTVTKVQDPPIDVASTVPISNESFFKMVLKIPSNVLPDNKEDLSIIFDLLQDKNPRLNTELWDVCTASYPNRGTLGVLVDAQSASVIKSKSFDPTRLGGRSCVVCAAPAELCCAKCTLTAYCGERCQRKDWHGRHKSVCHNLARWFTPMEPKSADKPETTSAPLTPLRRPRSPASHSAKRESVPAKHESPAHREPRRDHDDQHRPVRKFVPTGNKSQNKEYSQPRNNRNLNKFQKPQKTEEPEEEEWAVKAIPKPAEVKEPVIPKPATPKPEVKPPVVETVTEVKSAAVQKLVPETYLVETLSVGDSVLLSVESTASCGHSSTRGFVCLSLHERYEASYETLCGDYVVDCENDTELYKPVPGESFSYFDATDGAWYRARCLRPSQAALLDGCKLVALAAGDKHKQLPDKYAAIPEFCCVLVADGLQIGQSLKCSLVSKTASGYKVSIENVETLENVGEGEVSRWTPEVEILPSPAKPRSSESVGIPEVARPQLVNRSKVFLVDATAPETVFVRPSDVESQKLFDGILQDVVFYGYTSTPLSEPPQQGQEVIGKFTDGLHYRALCKRTNIKQNKYLLEYIEFGNMEVAKLENIHACPAQLSLAARPAVVARARLAGRDAFTLPALQYIEELKDKAEELLLNIASGAQTAASGGEITLTVVKNKESVNKKLQDMCTPEWKKIAERNGDVLECESVMFNALEYLELGEGPLELDVLEAGLLARGSLSACPRAHPHQQYVVTTLAAKMLEYCNSALGKQPYLPKREELCILQLPGSEVCERAVMCKQEGGAGGGGACVLLVDSGRVLNAPVFALRKMMPEFVTGLPGLALTVEIKDFPKQPTPEMLAKARAHLQLDESGRGVLRAHRAKSQQLGVYEVYAPDLIRDMTR